jgi:hypothetical protein
MRSALTLLKDAWPYLVGAAIGWCIADMLRRLRRYGGGEP